VTNVWRVGLLLVTALTTVAHADDPPGDPRDAFGFKKKPPKPGAGPAAAVECSDGKAFGCTGATDPLDGNASPYALSTWLPATYLLSLPVADASHDAVAHYALGASRDDAGVSVGGATGLENRWTIEGAPADGMRTGAADTRVPLLFLDGMTVTTGGFTARDRTSTGGTIDAQLRGGPTTTHDVDARVWAGYTTDPRQRPIAPASYFVRRGELEPGPELTAHVLATGPAGGWLGGTAWYAAGLGVEASTTKFTWRAATLVDGDGDGMADGFPGAIKLAPIDTYSQSPKTFRVPVMLRAGFERGVHHLDATLVGAVGTDVRYLYNSTLQASGVDGIGGQGDAMLTWRGTWKDTRARAQLAWQRSMRSEDARDEKARGIPQLLSAYVPDMLADDPGLSAACSDDPATDLYPDIPNCPVPISWFASGGAGPLSDVTGDRPSITLDLAHRLGNHVARVGATAEDTRLVTKTHFTGGAQIRSLFAGHTSERRFADPDAVCNADASLPCPTVSESVLRWRTRYTAAYVEDTWRAAPNVSFDGGLRWELMWVGTVLHFSDQVAPRLGASWEPAFANGNARVWASMGRSFAMLPAGLGQTILQRERTVDNVSSMFGVGRSVDTGAVTAVASGIEPIAQDELTTGARVQLARAIALTTWLQGRWLRRGIDTTDSGLDNPGRFGGTPAIRDTGLFAAEVATAPTLETLLRVGYMYGRTFGSWNGAFDPREGAVLYAGSDFDATSVNLLGRLPTDIGHRTYIEGQRSGTVGSVKLAVALRLTTTSGRPRSAIADSDSGLVYLLPRGGVGRGPAITQANVRVGASWQGVDITLDLFNVFNRREATAVDELYAVGAVRPIDRGSPEDLLVLKTEAGEPAPRRATYATATQYQSPRAAVLGIQRAF
jgi:hypothetical protein